MQRSRASRPEPSPFAERVLALVEKVPPGSAVTYGDVATMLGSKAPRRVGQVLARQGRDVPWWRVVRANGMPPAEHAAEALRRLAREKVPLRRGETAVDLKRARWKGPTSAPRTARTAQRASSRTSLQAAIAQVAARDPVVANLVALAGPLQHRPRDPDGHFGALVRAIVFQQLAGAAARAIHQRVRATVRGVLTPKALAAVSDASLRAAGLSANKLLSLRDLSQKVLDGSVDFDGSSKLSDDAIIDGLVTVRGIGRWTAEMYLMFELRRLDVWPVDDLGVRQGYALAWKLDPAPRAKELTPLGDRFRPYRSIVARYCWQAVALYRGGTDPSLR